MLEHGGRCEVGGLKQSGQPSVPVNRVWLIDGVCPAHATDALCLGPAVSLHSKTQSTGAFGTQRRCYTNEGHAQLVQAAQL